MLKKEENAGCHWGCWATQWIGAHIGIFVCKEAWGALAVATHTL